MYSAIVVGNVLVAPLPVQLTAFDVSMDANCTAKLSWKTAVEKSIVKFVAEYSTDSVVFSSIGEVAAKNSASGSQHVLLWSGASQGEGYYRLRMVETTAAICTVMW